MRIPQEVNILLVDDQPKGLFTLEAILKSPSYRLLKAKSGREALSLLLKHQVALIIMDVQMPEMDGFETVSLIKQRDLTKHIPIIFATAISKDEPYIYKGYKVGAVDYIFKPFDAEILKSKVSVFIDLHKKSEQIRYQSELLNEIERKNRIRQLIELEVESLRRYKKLADAVPNIIWKSQERGVIDYFNKYWYDYTGLSWEKSCGDKWQRVFFSEDLKNLLKLWQKAEIDKENFESECRIQQGTSDQFRWHLIRCAPELDHNNKIVSWLGTCIDIDEKKTAMGMLQNAKVVADEANQAKTRFLANMSHEIRTPLGAMLGFVELLLNSEQSAEERAQNIATLRRNGQQLLRIIDEILDVSKIEAGHMEFEKVEASLLDIILEVHSLLSISAMKKKISLNFKLINPVPKKIHTDPMRLRQILINIVGNAIKFTDSGSVDVEVDFIKPDSNQNQISFTVKDTGCGIKKEHMQQLFLPFMQGDSSTTRKFGGTGLGLALSRKLARGLNGDVVVIESSPKRGSTFRVTVAAGDVQNVELVKKLKLMDVTVPQKQFNKDALKGVRVLLVEDARDNQVLISRFLKASGAEVDVASNGLEGVERALSGNHEIVLMDVQMPELDGFGATEKLRTQGYKKPIIALTAHAMIEEKQKCLQVGCNAHLAKPVGPEALVKSIVELL